MRTLLLSLAALAFATACAFSHDGEGDLYPPDKACDELQDCFALKDQAVVQCVGEIPENPPDYDGALWACFEGSGCLVTTAPEGDETTTRAQFEAFIAGCFGDDVDASHALDAVWIDTFWTDLRACLVGASATQAQLIHLCYQ